MSLSIMDNFSYKGKKPNFARDSFDTLADMKNVLDSDIDDGHISYCKETKKHYIFDSNNTVTDDLGKWTEFTGSGETGYVGCYDLTYSNDFLNEICGTTDLVYFDTDDTDIKTKEYTATESNTFLNQVLGTTDVVYYNE